jgi:hypothetical protein
LGNPVKRNGNFEEPVDPYDAQRQGAQVSQIHGLFPYFNEKKNKKEEDDGVNDAHHPEPFLKPFRSKPFFDVHAGEISKQS